MLVTVIKGKGSLVYNDEKYSLQKGNHLIIPVGLRKFNINGSCQLIISH
ncbi:hypothetical protein ABES02_12155 [Neobacillus pocheonensis]